MFFFTVSKIQEFIAWQIGGSNLNDIHERNIEQICEGKRFSKQWESKQLVENVRAGMDG